VKVIIKLKIPQKHTKAVKKSAMQIFTTGMTNKKLNLSRHTEIEYFMNNGCVLVLCLMTFIYKVVLNLVHIHTTDFLNIGK
jgi:hypothetical protein